MSGTRKPRTEPPPFLAASLIRTLGGEARLAYASPVRRAIGMHPGVWRLVLSDGRRLVARHLPMAALMRGRPFDPLVVEPEVCRCLEGGPVAAVVGVDAGACVIFYEWCGDETLDDICQLKDPSAHRRCAERSRCVSHSV